MFQLACGDSLVKVVVLPSVPAKAAPGGIQGAAGFRQFTLTVGNIAQTMQACADAGRKVVVPEREIRPGVRIGIVDDPDGN
jgi:predicted enzyme related to lactoylglutathione lyase